MPKLDNNVLKEIGIYQWNEVRQKYSGSDLYLGNGFSIKISNKLNYKSLFERFIQIIPEASKTNFSQFGTTNFELILEKLNNAINVNQIFNIEHSQLTDSVNKLKNGLIEAINQNHPRHVEIENAVFDKLSVALDDFGDVFTTNYDTFLYRVVMRTKDRYNAGEKILPYQDYFWLRSGDYLKFMDTQNEKSYKSFYFLHGALFIFQMDNGNFKIRRGEQEAELLEIINDKINNGYFPLFVAEGTFQDKENKINRNGYLSFCRTKFKNSAKNLIIYGSSLSNQDAHFINDLNYNRRNLAISVYCEDKSIEELKAIKLDIFSKFNRFKNEEIVLFDSDSLF